MTFLRRNASSGSLLLLKWLFLLGSLPGGLLSGQVPASPVDATASSPTVTLRSGGSTLVCRTGVGTSLNFCVQGQSKSSAAEISVPLRAEILGTDGQRRPLEGFYNAANLKGDTLQAVGDLRTPAGTTFHFDDRYQPGPDGSFILQRLVTVLGPNQADGGFLTRFGLGWVEPATLTDCEGFLPGVWYLDNSRVPSRALAASLNDPRIWVREDRLPLPLVMLRRKAGGAALTLAHLQPDGGTLPADAAPGILTDARLQFGAVGVTAPTRPELTFVYPGTEADRTYLGRRRDSPPPADAGWRFHPVQAGVRHAYTLLLAGNQTSAFAPAMRWAWRAACAQAHPVPVNVALPAVYEASLHLLNNLAERYNGVPGLPFRVHLPAGTFARAGVDVSFQMGFVGQQLPAAYHLLRFGLRTHQPEFIDKAEAMLDFWSKESPTPEGLPRTWYDPYPQPHWRNYHTFLRVASDGMNGVLQAWDVAHRHGRDRPAWLRFCRNYGDWLIAHQNPDGSWFREYDFDGRAVHEGKGNTTHPIRFLVDLAAAMGERRYAEAAVRAGEWSLANVHAAFSYVGGTADNPNVIDKEAGFMATDAFLALHDLTGDTRYLTAATQAADFMETWVYAWTVPPMPGKATRGSLPARLPTSGFSLIATGHSAADLFLAGAPFLYERLYVATGDPHYHDVARLLLYNPRQFVDVNGSLGYGQPGLVTEALSLAVPRDGGVSVWLPWLTVSLVEPMVRLEETFGSMSLEPSLPTTGVPVALRERAAVLTRARTGLWQKTVPIK